jgi:hypothetical protein
MLILIVCLCINNKAEINQYLNSVIKKENHSQSTYDITISEDNSYPAWGEYDYSIEKLKIIKKGFFRNYIYVQVKNGGLCTAHAEYGWFSLTAKSCWAKWYFFNLKREVVDIVLRVAYDGGEPNTVGASNDSFYFSIIEEMGSKPVKRNLQLNVDVVWQENAKIKVNVEIKNNDNVFYFGILKAYVTEIESRWLDYDGLPYHYALLDFAINRPFLLFPKQSKTISKVWDGNIERNGEIFNDICF